MFQNKNAEPKTEATEATEEEQSYIALLVKNVNKQHLFELDENETTAVAQGWHDAISFLMYIMPKIGRETAYNVIVNNGPGAGIYFEFLPYTQETGGFEHLGLLLCQGNPRMVAEDVRDFLDIDTLNKTSIQSMFTLVYSSYLSANFFHSQKKGSYDW